METRPHFIPLDEIEPSKTNPRKNFDKARLAELADSIKTHGVLQPILLRPAIDTSRDATQPRYELVAGERRYLAAKAAELEHIPAITRDFTDLEVLEIQVIENSQRDDLHPLEEAVGYQRLIATKKYDVARIAERVGHSARYIYDRLRLLELTQDAQQLFLSGQFTAGHAILLSRLKDSDQVRAIKEGLFEEQHLLFDYNETGKPAKTDAQKAVSVGELRGWIDSYVQFDVSAPDVPELFPATAGLLGDAIQEERKVVFITKNHFRPQTREGEDVIVSTSWKRADGKMGARTCEHSVVGVVVIGQGRGESFNVCIAKKKCEVHWGSKIRAAKKNAAKRAAPGAEGEKARDRYAKEDARRKAAEAKKEAERARYKKVVPALLDALAAAVKKAPTKATGLLASVVIDACEDYRRSSKKASARVPVGTTADDLIRHVAFIVLQGELSNEYHGPTRAPKICKAFGLDAKKIIDEASPSAAGVCKKCGCTETTPCDDGGLPCAWTDKTETLCTACNKPKKKAAAKRRKKAKR